MKLMISSLVLLLALSTAAFGQERSPFTNIDFGLFMGWGNFIKVENPAYFDNSKTHFLIEVNGKGYKEIIKEAKAKYGKGYQCQLAEHFIATMNDLGVAVGQTVDLKLYLFDGGHGVIEVKDVPVTEANLDEIQFETNFCE